MCEYICMHVCTHMYIHRHMFMYIYECPRKKNLQTQKVQRDPRTWEVAGTYTAVVLRVQYTSEGQGPRALAIRLVVWWDRIGADTCSSGTFGGWQSQWKRVLIKDLYPPSSKHKEVYPSCSSGENQFKNLKPSVSLRNWIYNHMVWKSVIWKI